MEPIPQIYYQNILHLQAQEAHLWRSQCLFLASQMEYDDLYQFMSNSVLSVNGGVVFPYDTHTTRPLYDVLRYLFITRNFAALGRVISSSFGAGIQNDYLFFFKHINDFFSYDHVRKFELPELNQLISFLTVETAILRSQGIHEPAEWLETYARLVLKKYEVHASNAIVDPTKKV